MHGSLRIALVSPFAWGVPSAVNEHVADLARELGLLGHQPVVVVSSDDDREIYRMRRLFRRSDDLVFDLLGDWEVGEDCDPLLLPARGTGPLEPTEGIAVLPLGRSFPIRLNGSVANIGVPVDVRSRLERLLVGGAFDLVHVHEPVAPSVSFTAIRESRNPVVASFHLTPVALMAYELGQVVLDRFYTRLDARVVTSAQAAHVLREFFGGDYRVVPSGTTVVPLPAEDAGGHATLLYVYRGDDHRGLRALLRALQACPPAGDWQLRVAVHLASADRWPPRPAPRRLRSRVSWHEFDRAADLSSLYASATVVVAPFLGGEWLLPTLIESLQAGCRLAAPDLPVARELVSGGDRAAFFDPNREASLAEAIGAASTGTSPVSAGELGGRAAAAAMVDVYQEIVGATSRRPGRTDRGGNGGVRRSISPREMRGPLGVEEGWLYADLHVHTDYSKDCTVPVPAVLAAAREVGLGALAIADHNTICGALEAAASAPEDLIVIVAEEVMTQQGEVIGLFLREEIPKGLSFDETLSLIKEQGGLVYIPHPFDGLRTTPSYRAMVDNLHRIDVIETYNTRNFLSSFNLNAERFAAKYNIAAGAGSDSHVLPGLGTAMLRMPRFDGPESFMAGLREADIVTRRKSLLYLQSLKILRTTLDAVLPGS